MSLTLNAELREDMGKGASRRLRHAKKLPAIVYGGKKDPVSITLLQKEVQHELPNEDFYSQILSLNIDGKPEDVLLRDIQHHPYKQEVMHMDFVRIDQKQVVHVHTPLHFVGEDSCPGVKTEGGVISHVIMEVEMECLPKNIPQHIEVDLSEMHLGDIIHLSDLKLPEGVEIMALKHGDEHDSAVVSCHARKVIAEEEETEAPEAPEAEGEAEEGGDSE
ncbi:MAG TPA: 50S ribosomal protein L25/general stress protein Ctc [Gammaproteobacteria bacterium]|nr:50S ribosomal protein L25/general stress protein Ctc [Gammaproteobacteria bacterium]